MWPLENTTGSIVSSYRAKTSSLYVLRLLCVFCAGWEGEKRPRLSHIGGDIIFLSALGSTGKDRTDGSANSSSCTSEGLSAILHVPDAPLWREGQNHVSSIMQ